MPAAARSRPGSSTRTRTCCSPARARASSQLRQRGAGYLEILAAGGGILSTVAATRAASTDELLAHGRRWLDEMLGHGVTTIEAKSGLRPRPRDRDPAARGRLPARPRGPDRGRPDLARRARRPARVPRRGRTGPRPTSGSSSRSSCPASPPTAGRGSATSSARTACSAPTSRGGSCDGRGGYGLATAAARRRARPVAAARSWPPRSARRRPTTSRRRRRPGIDALAAAAGGRPAGRRDAPAGDDLVPDEGPRRAGPDVHRPRRPGRDRHRLQPGHVADASLPLAMTVACLELGLTPDEALAAVTINAARALGLEDEIGSLEAGQERRPRRSGASRRSTPDPVLAGRRPGADRRQARPGRPRPGLSRRRPARPRPACRATPAGRSSSRPAGSTR